MSINFSAEEILKMAIRIEENGEKFYRSQADKLSGQGEEQFLILADEEKEHKDNFQKLNEQLESNALHYDDELAERYLASLSDSRVFVENKITRLLKTAEKPQEIINYAIMLEKESIIFYYGLLEMAGNKASDVVQEIIRQEKEHVRKLNNLTVGT